MFTSDHQLKIERYKQKYGFLSDLLELLCFCFVRVYKCGHQVFGPVVVVVVVVVFPGFCPLREANEGKDDLFRCVPSTESVVDRKHI